MYVVRGGRLLFVASRCTHLYELHAYIHVYIMYPCTHGTRTAPIIRATSRLAGYPGTQQGE